MNKEKIVIDFSQLTDVQLGEVCMSDWPDFSDAYIADAKYKGRDITEDELEVVNEDSAFIYKCILDGLCF